MVYLQTDYVVVGTGSAGSVPANLLSADPGSHLVVLEAGPRDKDKFIHIPAALGKLFQPTGGLPDFPTRFGGSKLRLGPPTGYPGLAAIFLAYKTLVRDQLPEGMGLVDLGEHRLRDLGRPTRLVAATCLAECARAFADDRPELAGVLQGAAYAAFRRASPAPNGTSRAAAAPVGPNANFLLTALRETGDLVAAALGDPRQHELRTTGAAMSMDEAISYALANIDPKLLTGPVTFG